ncbi:hypothetical protein EDC01DRAFT_755252 [Geopyxis carbonaria]|nr:hypothetical protein EDC01DRAFT_755252 [Geopyxis carbonaria]
MFLSLALPDQPNKLHFTISPLITNKMLYLFVLLFFASLVFGATVPPTSIQPAAPLPDGTYVAPPGFTLLSEALANRRPPADLASKLAELQLYDRHISYKCETSGAAADRYPMPPPPVSTTAKSRYLGFYLVAKPPINW